MEITLQEEDINTELEQTGPNSMDLEIRVQQDAIQRELDRTYEQLKDNVEVPGFRKGKVPLSVVKKKYGQVVQDDLLKQMLQKSLEMGISDHDLDVVGEPEFLDKPERLEEGESLEYTVNLETVPEVDIPDYGDIEVEKPSLDVSEDEVEDALENARREYAELSWVEEGTVQEDDVIVADVQLHVDGEEVTADENVEIQINENIRIFNVHHPEIAEHLTGLSTGDEHTVEFNMPEDVEPEEFQDKPAKVVLEIHEIKRPELPELDEDFAEELGCDSVDELREKVREQVRDMKENQQEEKVHEQVVDALIERTEFEVPERLLDQGTEEFLQQQQMRMSRAGVPNSVIQEKLADHREESRDSIERYMKKKYILDEIADREKIFVTEEEVDDYVEQLASEQDMWPHELEEELESRNEMDQLRRDLKEQKVLNYLLEQVTVTEE